MASEAAGGARMRTNQRSLSSGQIDQRKKRSCKSAYSRNSSAVGDTEVSETSPILINEDIWVCELCQGKFENENDKLLQCERCMLTFCCSCLGMSNTDYSFLKDHPDFHWFCSSCQAPALKSVQTDREIEERCKEFLEKYDKKLEEIDKKLDEKAEKATVDNISANLKASDTKVEGLAKDITDLADKIDLLKTEHDEIKKREKNLIIKGIPEVEEETATEQAQALFDLMELDVNIKSAFRLKVADSVKNSHPNSDITRSIKVVMSSVSDMKAVLRKAKSIKDIETDQFDASKVFVTPDLTKLQREQDFKNRQELKRRRNVNPNWVIRGGRLHLRRDPPLGEYQ